MRASEPTVGRLLFAIRRVWAFPATALGLVATLVAMAFGATARVVDGVIETAGGGTVRFVALLPRRLRFGAMTLGHVIVGIDHATLAAVREHEHAHVRQYERWGFLFLPLYLGSCLVQLATGRDPYWDNRFERQAYAQSATSPRADSPRRSRTPRG
jgi:hypothetical protein